MACSFEEASRLRDQLLLARMPFDTLLFVKRKPFFSEQPFMDAHHLFNRPGGGIYRLSPVRPDGRVTPVVDSLGEGVYRDLCLHWDARRLLFAFGNGSDNVGRQAELPHLRGRRRRQRRCGSSPPGRRTTASRSTCPTARSASPRTAPSIS